jgi:putative hydrolase of the HAD superfamily
MIFFDIDGTLVDHATAEFKAAVDFYNDSSLFIDEPPELFAKRWKMIGSKYMEHYLRGDISFQEQRRARMRDLVPRQLPLTDREADRFFDIYLEKYREHWALYPDTLPCLERYRGHSLGVISNGNPRQQNNKLEKLGIHHYFQVVVISGELGIAKPEPGIFTAACRNAGRKEKECVFIGDDLEADVQGSARAGLHPLWLDREGSGETTEFTTIQTLSELEEMIKSPNKSVHSI